MRTSFWSPVDYFISNFFILARVSVDMSSGKVRKSLSVDGTRTVGRDIKPDVEVAQCVLQYNGVCEA